MSRRPLTRETNERDKGNLNKRGRDLILSYLVLKNGAVIHRELSRLPRYGKARSIERLARPILVDHIQFLS